MSYINTNFQTIAKVQTGQVTKYRYATLKALLADDEKMNGPTIHSRITFHQTAKPQTHYCSITHYPKRYFDPASGMNYYDPDVYAYIQSLSKGQLLQYQQLND